MSANKILICLIGLIGVTPSWAAKIAKPVADAHFHYNVEHTAIISPARVVETWRTMGIALVVAQGTPNMAVVELYHRAPDIVRPLFSPILSDTSRYSWHRDKRVLFLADYNLRQEKYHGIGEIPLGGADGAAANNEIVQGLFRLARIYNVPIVVAVDASSIKQLSVLCRQYPTVRVLWTHSLLSQFGEIEKIIKQCKNVWIDLAANRADSSDSIVDNDGVLYPYWHALLIRYPQRFMIGSEPLWKTTSEETDQQAPAVLWQNYHASIAFHDHWLAQLPDEIASRIRVTNAQALFSVTLY